MLAGVQVKHEVGEGALHLGAEVPVDGEAGAGKFGGALEVEDAELLAQFPMRLGSEIELGRGAPLADLKVVAGVFPRGHAGMRDVGNGDEQGAQLGV